MPLRVKERVVLRTVRAELAGPALLRLEGVVSQDDVRRDLARLLEEAHTHILASQLSAFTLDVRGLTFASSSAIRVFIDMASRAQRAGYRLIIEIDGSVTWHRLNFSVLQSLTPESVELRDVRHVVA